MCYKNEKSYIFASFIIFIYLFILFHKFFPTSHQHKGDTRGYKRVWCHDTSHEQETNACDERNEREYISLRHIIVSYLTVCMYVCVYSYLNYVDNFMLDIRTVYIHRYIYVYIYKRVCMWLLNFSLPRAPQAISTSIIMDHLR